MAKEAETKETPAMLADKLVVAEKERKTVHINTVHWSGLGITVQAQFKRSVEGPTPMEDFDLLRNACTDVVTQMRGKRFRDTLDLIKMFTDMLGEHASRLRSMEVTNISLDGNGAKTYWED